jgi:hypothetical protein
MNPEYAQHQYARVLLGMTPSQLRRIRKAHRMLVSLGVTSETALDLLIEPYIRADQYRMVS